MTVFYKEADLAEVCYIFEAADWLAVGEIPEFYASEKGSEARLAPTAHDDQFSPVSEPLKFLSEEQFSLLSVQMTFREYEDALEDTWGESTNEIASSVEKLAELFRGEDSPEIRAYVAQETKVLQRRLEAANLLEAEMEPFQHKVDQARASIFLALSKGELEANGYLLKLDEAEQFQHCEVVEIPESAWLWSNVDWDKASTLVDGEEVIGAYVDTSELFERFPTPFLEPVEIAGRRYGSTIVDIGHPCTFELKGRLGWTMAQLVDAGPSGVTTIERPALRLAAYVHSLRKRGIPIETEIETHDGPYAGQHARYRLACDASVRVLT